jgi:hypothetical protein
MEKRKIISILLVSLLALTAIGCGKTENKTVESTDKQAVTDVVKEEAFTTVPEEKLVTDYMKKSLSHEDSFVQDGAKFSNLYVNDTVDNDLIKKYNLEYDPKVIYKTEDLHSKYPELYEAGVTKLFTMFHIQKESDDVFVNKKLGKQISSYISDVWKGEKNTDYVLAKDFEKLKPKDIFQTYLKENKIEIKEIIYPTFVTGFNDVPGAEVATVKVTIKGTQNKKEFEKTLTLDFYFAPNDEIKNGHKKDDKLSDKDFEIMAVSTGTVPADKFKTFFKYDINAAREKFAINQTK